MGPLAAAVVLNDKQAIATPKFRAPSTAKMHECTTAEQFKALEAPPAPDENAVGATTRSRANDAVEFDGVASFIPSPFVGNFVADASSNDPAVIAPALLLAAKAFDEANKDDPDYNQGAATEHAEIFARWAWGVMKKSIPETRFTIHPDDGELKIYADQRHKAFIFSSLDEVQTQAATNPNNDAVMTQLSSSISHQAEKTAEANNLRREELQLRKDREEHKKDKLKKLHPSVKNMLINAAATYCQEENEYRTHAELPSSCMAFFNSENVGTADQELAEQFEAMGMPEASYSQATVQALWAGHFLYVAGMEPSNFTAFGFNEQTPTLVAGPNRTLLLYLAATQGKGKTTEEISRSTKQWVKAPTTYEELNMQIALMMGISTTFFTEECALVPSLSTFQESLKLNKMCVKIKIVSNNLYASKILYAIDTRTQCCFVCARLPRRGQLSTTPL